MLFVSLEASFFLSVLPSASSERRAWSSPAPGDPGLPVTSEARAWEMEGELTVAYAGMGWEVEGVIEFDLQEWRKLEVEVSLELPGIELGSKLTLDPIKACLKKLVMEASFEAWAYSVEPSGLSEWDRTVLVLAVQPEASWELTFTACFEPGSIAEIALGLDIEW